MDWSAFFGAIVGVVIIVSVLFGAIFIWDYFDRRRPASNPSNSSSNLDSLLEIHLEEFIVRRFDTLFPGWKIYKNHSNTSDDKPKPSKLKGIRYRTQGGEIDILCLDENDDFVVIELKRGKAPDRVVAQIDRYIAWVEKNLAKPSQKVRGIVIAKSFNNHIFYSLSKRDGIDLWIYDWQLTFTQQETQKVL